MIKTFSAQEIKNLFGLEAVNSSKVTQVGGLAVFLAFLRKIHFKQRLEAEFGSLVAKALLEVMLGLFVGATSMEAIARAAKDKLIKTYLVKPVGAIQLVKILRKMTPSQLQCLHEFSLSQALLDITGDTFKGERQVLDWDATADEKYGSQEGVEFGYIERDTIRKCYQYLLIRHDALNTILYGTIRGGAAHSQNNFCGYLRSILPMFKGEWALTLRCDSGFFNEEAFEICGENKTFFFIKAPMVPSRVDQAIVKSLVWNRPEGDDSGVEYAVYVTCTAKSWEYREVFKRTPDTANEHGFRFDCIATNNLKHMPWDVFDFYNKRARIENTNLEFKDDFNLGKVVTKWFGVNDAITQATIVLYQLFSHFKRRCLDKADKAKRISTLRTEIFNVPAEILSSARRTWHRIYNENCDPNFYARILSRIEALKSVLAIAHLLNTS